jgi:peptidoglycan/xylan/chitin deacetylase (PgdA/CDA1 family)
MLGYDWARSQGGSMMQKPSNHILIRHGVLTIVLLALGLFAARFLLWRGPASQAASVPTKDPLALAIQQTLLVTATSQVSLTPTASETPLPSETPEPSTTPTDTPEPSPTASATPTLIDTPWATSTPIHIVLPSPAPSATPLAELHSDGRGHTLRVPILMYHYVSTPPEGSNAIRQDLSVPPHRFEEHLFYLHEAGYTSISLDDLCQSLQTGQALPEKPIVITFDDGYRDIYTQAFPLLRKYGFTATVFLITDVIDQRHPEYLTWDQVTEMDTAGMRMEAHSRTHPDLRGRSTEYLIGQLAGAKEAIEAHTQRPVRFFCYPAGKYDEQVIQVLRSAHYWGAVTTNFGAEHHAERMFEMPRIRVRGHHSVVDLATVIALGMRAP